nr:redoxin domain-containing protein [Anaerolineae bacterium]
MTGKLPDQGRSFPVALVIIMGSGLVVGMLMALFTILNPTRTGSIVPPGGPTPIPDSISAGQIAPDFTSLSSTGETIQLSQFRGRIVALNFWASWCAPCRIEMPVLEAAHWRYASSELVILAVNVGESEDIVRGFVEELSLSFTIVLDPAGDIMALYEVRPLPTTIWIDPEGIIRIEHLGILTEQLVDGYISDILNGQSPSP